MAFITSKLIMKHDRDAFTLVELLVVLVMISLLVGSIEVSFSGRSAVYALDMACKDLAAAIEYASMESSTRQRVYRIVFRNDDMAFRVEYIEDSLSDDFVPVKGMVGRWRRFDYGVKLVAVFRNEQLVEPIPEELYFTPSRDSIYEAIQLSGKDGQRRCIHVAACTQQVLIDECFSGGDDE